MWLFPVFTLDSSLCSLFSKAAQKLDLAVSSSFTHQNPTGSCVSARWVCLFRAWCPAEASHLWGSGRKDTGAWLWAWKTVSLTSTALMCPGFSFQLNGELQLDHRLTWLVLSLDCLVLSERLGYQIVQLEAERVGLVLTEIKLASVRIHCGQVYYGTVLKCL